MAIPPRYSVQVIEKACLATAWRLGEARVPIAQGAPEGAASLLEPLGFSLHGRELDPGQLPHTPAGSLAPVSPAEHLAELGQGESASQSPPHEPHAGESFGTIFAIPALASRRPRQEPQSLVMAERVGAHPSLFGHGTDAEHAG